MIEASFFKGVGRSARSPSLELSQQRVAKRIGVYPIFRLGDN